MASMIAGKTDRNGFTWIRCINPECGDSVKHNWKAHCLVDKKGSTYCFKCGQSTTLSIDLLMQIALGNKSIDEALDEAIAIRTDLRPWASQRPTRLATYGIDDDPLAVAFPMRDHNGEIIGWHDRKPGEKGINTGRRGLGYVGRTPKSSPANPLIIVEGPFDVISDRHVCTFGTITKSTFRYLKLHYVWLQPDPDIIDTDWKRSRFVQNVVNPVNDALVFVQGVIVGNADPDEATQLMHFTLDEVQEWIQ